MIESFEELGLSPELVESLAAEGIERPTELQEEAIPVIHRGHNLIARAGPGAGTLVAYGVPLLQRLEPEGASPRALILTPSADVAAELAESLARLAAATGHSVAALGSPWTAGPSAHFVFASPGDALEAVRASRLKLDELGALVIDGAAAIRGLGGWTPLETLAALVPREAQRILLTLPADGELEEFAGRHVRRANRVPAGAPQPQADARPVGTIHYLVVEGSRDEAACAFVSHALADGAKHVILYCRSDDRAADAGDLLALHGFTSGAPGDASAPIWLGSDTGPAPLPAAGRELEDIATLSYDVPPDARTLASRHGWGGPATAFVLPRELNHLKEIAARARLRAVPAAAPAPTQLGTELAEFREQLRRAVRETDLTPQLLLIEPLIQEFTAAEVAAAAVALLRRKPGSAAATGAPAAGAPAPPAAGAPARPPAWTRLFISVGQRDGIGPGDLLGAVTGETGIEGSRVGKIEVRDTFSRVEVASDVAEAVIRALNGTTIRGRSARVDYDRVTPGRGRAPRRHPQRNEPGRTPDD
ncbi:MAG: DEAD/DEAH box helicase [Gemmatimonadetes bacterium]|nr:DEAD/DEAH box helicase [Gemmatimonadota bacterium]